MRRLKEAKGPFKFLCQSNSSLESWSISFENSSLEKVPHLHIMIRNGKGCVIWAKDETVATCIDARHIMD